jgi:CheY-like chemotaxis protein
MNVAAHQPVQRSPQQRCEPPAPPSFTACENRPRVLVVEDDPIQALLLTLMLEHVGAAPTLVTDGAQAIEAVKTASYDLVLMDYRMPVTDGIEATRSIRVWEREAARLPMPIVAVTASGMVNECRRYTEAGMTDVVLKPFSAKALADLMARHCSSQADAHTQMFTDGVTS